MKANPYKSKPYNFLGCIVLATGSFVLCNSSSGEAGITHRQQVFSSDRSQSFNIAQAIRPPSCDEEEVEEFVELLREAPKQSTITIKSLVTVCGESATPTIDKILKLESNSTIRIYLVKALSDIKGEASVKVLITVLKSDPESSLRTESAKSLGKLGSKSAIPALMGILANEKELDLVRQTAASALGSIGGPTVVIPLVNAMKNTRNSLSVRSTAGSTLVKVKDLAIASVTPIIKDPNAGLQIRYWAVKILSEINTPKSIQVLDLNKSKVLKILDDAIKIPNNIVELDRALGKPILCRWSWVYQYWGRCR